MKNENSPPVRAIFFAKDKNKCCVMWHIVYNVSCQLGEHSYLLALILKLFFFGDSS